ncbi:Molybdenum cofactor biosynthesis protein MoaA [Chondromyces apiculatus DSM 436]|uniref:Molybdenum cofactor biosynthesis protein MoaA n=1 Tax=Chondromyces apiculatus DSM 436 TaxID=1192034 RepID=A0A017T985_9BACT|nr:Molybdenum cofactor biosynthesis protein MoaA [Chondromyces apiculatus DSM 436]
MPLIPRPVTPPIPPRSVRLSVTDRCDFACTYCRPSRHDGYAESRLVTDAFRTMLRALREAGVRRVRLTGGEPLIHPEIVDLVAFIASLGFDDVALTTNASQLSRLAAPLRDAGLQRLNISIDTLDPERFRAMTRGGDLAQVLRGIDAALRVGFAPIKLNTVVLRGENDDEIEKLTLWAWERRMVPRFLEVMPIAEGAKLAKDHLVTAAEMRERLAGHLVEEEAVVEPGLGPARYVRARRDPGLRVGFISGTSDTYCATCDRLRVSSTGVLRPCLATDDGVDASQEARAGDLAGILARLDEAWRLKPDGTIWKGCTEDTAAGVSMRAIGG